MRADALQWWQTRRFMALAAFAATLPLWWPDVPPLTDLPGHMGRYRVQLALGDHPHLAQWYDFRWRLIGNLGLDLLIVPLSPLFGLETAVKLVVAGIPALIVTGLLWIAREAHGRVPATALLALPLAYGYPFQFGFVNFTLSMGLALNLFALWLRLARLNRFGLRAWLFVPASCLLWLCHAFGWGVLGLLAFSAEFVRHHDSASAERSLSARWLRPCLRAGAGCAPLALPLSLMVFWRSGDETAGQTGDWFNWRVKLSYASMVLRDRWRWWDLVSTVLLYTIVVKGVRDPRVGYARGLGLAALLLWAAFLLLPRIVFGSAYADMRLVPFALAMSLIAIRPKQGVSPHGAAVIAAVGLAFFGARLAGTAASFAIYDRSYDRALAALPHIPIGSRVVTFTGRGCEDDWAHSRLEHIPGLLPVRRLAFSNDQWSMAGAQLLTLRHAAARGFAADPSQIVTGRRCPGEWWRPIDEALAAVPREAFDYIWLIEPPAFHRSRLRGLRPVWRDGPYSLWRIDRCAASRSR